MHGILMVIAAGLVAGASGAPTIAAPAAPMQMRCGWLINETPGNFDLLDRDGTWEIAAQGGYQADGMDDMPDMSEHGWVETNGAHGYGCACLHAVVDRANKRVVRFSGAVSKPIAACSSDKMLPKVPADE